MCAGCVQSGVEFATANAAFATAGARGLVLRARDRLGLSHDSVAARRARHEAEAAAFLEGLGLDAAEVLGWPAVPDGVPAAGVPLEVEVELVR